MNFMYNGSSLPIGGGSSKITDYLEDPVEITNFTHIDICNLSNEYILFGDFYYNSSITSIPPVRYVGYISLSKLNTTHAHAHFGMFPLVAYSYSYNSSHYFKIGIPCLYYNTTLQMPQSYFINISGLDAVPITYPSDNYSYFLGKIWVGKYKQQITE